MVIGYTANEYGDYLIASLKEPYLNTLKVLDWNIIAGVQNYKTQGTVSIVSGSTTVQGLYTNFTSLAAGDIIILGNTEYEIASIESAVTVELTTAPDFTTTGLDFYLAVDNSNRFDYEYRWSQTNAQYSEFLPLTKGYAYNDLFSLNFDPTKPLWLDVKAEVAALGVGNTLVFIGWEFTLQKETGQVESCPQFCVECTDPFAYDGCANIEVACDTNLFQPYNLNKTTTIYKQLVNITNDIFGHQVQYFRTEPDKRSEDVILMEYSLFNVVDKQNVKILVPDNEFPEENPTYDIFGMEFAEFAVHITAVEFERAFGFGKTPRNLDYMYIPIINKMYEVSSVGLADEFNKSHSYWRVKLVKFQDRSSVLKNNFEQDTDNLVTGVEEIFGERQREEQVKDTNPMQFQTVSTAYRDGIRSFVDRGLTIQDYDLKNRWTVVSKNYYKLTDIQSPNVAIEYAIESKLASDSSFAISLWFNPQFETTDTGEYILFGDLAAMNGFKLFVSQTSFRVSVAGIDYVFNHGLTLQKDTWYGYILNINNEFMQMSSYLYRLDQTNNRGTVAPNRPQDASNNLIEEFGEVKDVGLPIIWTANSNYNIRGNKTYMTNIRVFDRVIEFEQHHNILNQYVVRDNQRALLIDNAIPSLGYQRFKNAR
jgi:hypothetical protein